jgi:hypothetical protein|tara:strand:+ start:85729 stop:86031 length:303 start_codon:yes stop_codon:yes gene_type:complete
MHPYYKDLFKIIRKNSTKHLLCQIKAAPAGANPRQRETAETSRIVRAGAIENGFDKNNIHIIDCSYKAIDHAFSVAQPDDLIVVQAYPSRPYSQARHGSF